MLKHSVAQTKKPTECSKMTGMNVLKTLNFSFTWERMHYLFTENILWLAATNELFSITIPSGTRSGTHIFPVQENPTNNHNWRIQVQSKKVKKKQKKQCYASFYYQWMPLCGTDCDLDGSIQIQAAGIKHFLWNLSGQQLTCPGISCLSHWYIPGSAHSRKLRDNKEFLI